MSLFFEPRVSMQDEWRSIILFGRNVATYKFALAKSLLELSGDEHEAVSLEELAVPFSRHICEHLQLADKQITSSNSRFLDACRAFNRGETSENDLHAITVQLGFNNVIDAFHVVARDDVPTRFFVDERRGAARGIRLTDALLELSNGAQALNLESEVESRWRLVETAWTLRMPRAALTVEHEAATGLLLPRRGIWERQAITAARDALNGYQRGACFYCGAEISLDGSSDSLQVVDHFFPHVLKPAGIADPIDGVWNLVLACRTCNRGSNGKFDRLPELPFLEKLHARNGYLIESNHPLRETIQQQIGSTEPERRHFLQQAYNDAAAVLVHRWAPASA